MGFVLLRRILSTSTIAHLWPIRVDKLLGRHLHVLICSFHLIFTSRFSWNCPAAVLFLVYSGHHIDWPFDLPSCQVRMDWREAGRVRQGGITFRKSCLITALLLLARNSLPTAAGTLVSALALLRRCRAPSKFAVLPQTLPVLHHMSPILSAQL